MARLARLRCMADRTHMFFQEGGADSLMKLFPKVFQNVESEPVDFATTT